jgi:hypothetical protein
VRTGAVCVAIAATTAPVHAQTSATAPPAAAAALARARDAWSDGDFDVAPELYQKALKAGGLSRAEVLDAYVRAGAALAVTGKKRPALAELRHAALLDPTFTLPLEAGKKAVAIAQRARKEQRRVGTLTVSAVVQEEVGSGAPFAVHVTITPDHDSLVDAVALEVRDKLAGRAYERQSAGAAHVRFDVPTRMTLPDATLVVRVQARDANGNELVTTEKRVHVRPAAPMVTRLPPVLTPGGALASRADTGREHPARADTGREHPSGGGFWHTAWPYILGGTALAAGGTAVYFATRPTADVNVGAAHVTVVP